MTTEEARRIRTAIRKRLSEWNNYRRIYPSLSFNDKKLLREDWKIELPIQEGWKKNIAFFLKYIGRVIKITGKEDVSIVEYGGYDGGLAALMMKKYPHLKWVNVDIVPHIAKAQLKDHDYREHVLKDEIWIEKPNFENLDVFLSSDSIEHITYEQIIQLFNYIDTQKIKYMIHAITVKPWDQPWKDYAGAHVCNTGSIGLKEMMIERGYNLIWDDHPHRGLA